MCQNLISWLSSLGINIKYIAGKYVYFAGSFGILSLCVEQLWGSNDFIKENFNHAGVDI
jgi:hypothetical protein